MCSRHSFLLTRAGKILDGLGVTDSHTEIRELHGLKNTDDTVNDYEWRPPAGWPNADWNLGLTKYLEVFETKSSHEAAMERHIKMIYPTMAEWNAGDRPRITADILRDAGWCELLPDAIHSGDTNVFVVDAPLNVTGQTGGYCWGLDSATLNVSGQIGGDCRGYDSATLNVTGQTGGYCRGYDSATLNVSGQTGGECRGLGSATLNVSGQTGGYCRGYDSATLNVTGQTGGECRGYDSTTLNKLD